MQKGVVVSPRSHRSLPPEQKEERRRVTRISSRGRVIIALLFVLGMINFGDKAVLGLSAVPIMKELQVSPAQYGLVSGSFFWAFGVSSLVVTAWSDRIGTKTVLALLAMAWALVQMATWFVFTFPVLLLTRVVLGAGEGPSYGTSVAAAALWLPAEQRTFGLAIISLGSWLGPAVLTPPLALLIATTTWRFAFVLLGGMGVLWVVLWLLVGRERPEASSASQDKAPVEARKMRWLYILRLICTPTLLFSIVAAFGFYWANALYLNWNPIYLATVHHLGPGDPLYIAGLTLPYLAGGISLVASGAFADFLFRRTGSYRRAYVYSIAAVFGLNALCLYAAVNASSSGAVLFLTLAPIVAGIPMVSTIITAVTPVAYRGAVLGIVVAVSSVSGIIASLVTGLIIQATGEHAASGFQNAYLLASVLLLLIGGAFLVWVRPDGKTSDSERVM